MEDWWTAWGYTEKEPSATQRGMGEHEDSERYPKEDSLADTQLTLNVVWYFSHSESSLVPYNYFNK